MRVRVRVTVTVKLTRRTTRVLDLADVHGLLAALDHAGVVGRVAVESDLHAERDLPRLRQALRRVVPEVVDLHLVRARGGDHARLGYG